MPLPASADPAAYLELGNRYLAEQAYDKAVAAFYECLKKAPSAVAAALGLATASRELGKLDIAIRVLETSLRFNPGHLRLLTNLGAALEESGASERAVEVLESAYALYPSSVEATFNLGNAYRQAGNPAKAAWAYQCAVDLRPDDHDALLSAAAVLASLHRVEEAAEFFVRYRAVGGRELSSAMVFVLDHLEGTGFAEHQSVRREWAAQFAGYASDPCFTNDRDPDRPLKVGYVSGDFNMHAAAFACAAIFFNHDPANVAVACYPTSERNDAATERLRASATLWRSIAGLSDDEALKLIREDQIDILVDLSSHTDGNRLALFARRAAPIQITGIGTGAGTGLATMDYLISDPVAVPPSVRHLFAETILDLPCFLAWDPTLLDCPAPAPRQAGPLTFGCFNRLGKVSKKTLDLWGRILMDFPSSRLVLKDRRFKDDAVRDYMSAEFTRRGISVERIVMLGGTRWYEHMEDFSAIDIALDPFPINGGISTYEPLWMGVPVVTLLGNSMPGRAAGAILTALNLEEYVAQSESEYLEVVRRLVENDKLRASLRQTLRERIAQSRLAPARYTRALEDVYRSAWRRYLSEGGRQ